METKPAEQTTFMSLQKNEISAVRVRNYFQHSKTNVQTDHRIPLFHLPLPLLLSQPHLGEKIHFYLKSYFPDAISYSTAKVKSKCNAIMNAPPFNFRLMIARNLPVSTRTIGSLNPMSI